MEKRKGQNSILFVATLGVYLGLMLAGATPQVLANAATTRSFDIKDEIEFQDKLDKDPDPLAAKLASDSVDDLKRDKFVPLARLLKQFRPFLPVSVFHSTAYSTSANSAEIASTFSNYNDLNARLAVPKFSGLQVNHLARSSIDQQLANDAK